MIKLANRPRLRSDVRFRRIGDEGVVLRQADAEVMVVNDLGVGVLEQIDGQRTVGAILDTLGSQYDVGRAQLEADVLGYLGELADRGAILLPDDEGED